MTDPHRPRPYLIPVNGAPTLPPPPLSKPTIQASELSDSQYPGRRITFRGATGVFKGIAFTSGLVLDANGQTRTVPSTPHIHIVDDCGAYHYLGFDPTADSVTLLN